MGFYKNTSGVLTPIAGRGRAEYGASTVRTGTIIGSSVVSSEQYTVTNIVFSTPMPDDDYLVVINSVYTSAKDLNYGVISKTKNGFTVKISNPFGASVGWRFTYTAFKLYTDTEYNSLLDLPDRVEALETTTSGNISGATTNSGTITNATYARSGNVVQLRLTLTGASLTTHANTTLNVTMPSTVPVPVMTILCP